LIRKRHVITLTEEDIDRAARVGLLRMKESIRKGHKDRKQRKSEAERLGVDIIGAFGELSMCKIMGWEWSGSVGSYKGPDAKQNIEIRTRTNWNHDLIVKPYDNMDHVFVLVIGSAPTYEAVGWITGREVEAKFEIKDPGGGFSEPCFFVPQSCLHPIDSIYSVMT